MISYMLYVKRQVVCESVNEIWNVSYDSGSAAHNIEHKAAAAVCYYHYLKALLFYEMSLSLVETSIIIICVSFNEMFLVE